MLFFIQTLSRILCAGAISPVSFLDLFGPIAGVTNPIMYTLSRRIEKMAHFPLQFLKILNHKHFQNLSKKKVLQLQTCALKISARAKFCKEMCAVKESPQIDKSYH